MFGTTENTFECEDTKVAYKDYVSIYGSFFILYLLICCSFFSFNSFFNWVAWTKVFPFEMNFHVHILILYVFYQSHSLNNDAEAHLIQSFDDSFDINIVINRSMKQRRKELQELVAIWVTMAQRLMYCWVCSTLLVKSRCNIMFQ